MFLASYYGERTYVPWYLCSPNLCSLVPMFPGTYVPWCLCSPVPMFPGFCTLIVVISINRLQILPTPWYDSRLGLCFLHHTINMPFDAVPINIINVALFRIAPKVGLRTVLCNTVILQPLALTRPKMIFHVHVMLLSILVQQKKIIIITLQNYYSMILEMNMILARDIHMSFTRAPTLIFVMMTSSCNYDSHLPDVPLLNYRINSTHIIHWNSKSMNTNFKHILIYRF